MRILITHELFPPDMHGGGERVVYELAKHLRDRGAEVEVATTGDPRVTEYEGIPTHRLHVNRYLMNFASSWIKKYAKDADIIQTNNYNACYASWKAAKSLNKPVICLVHGMYGKRWLKMRGPIFGYLSYVIEKFQIKRDYDKIIFLSKYARDQAVDLGVPMKITEVIKPGIPRGLDSYKIGKKEPFVLFVGRLAKQKGLDNLIEAAKCLPGIRFLIAGEGEEERRLRSIAPPNVEFLGFVSEKKVTELYSRALVFCLPSIGEGFGLVLIEAMASGCAIVSTVPLDFEGKHVPINDSESLMKAIKELMETPAKTKELGKKNANLAKEYSWDGFLDRYDEICKELLRRKN